MYKDKAWILQLLLVTSRTMLAFTFQRSGYNVFFQHTLNIGKHLQDTTYKLCMKFKSALDEGESAPLSRVEITIYSSRNVCLFFFFPFLLD